MRKTILILIFTLFTWNIHGQSAENSVRINTEFTIQLIENEDYSFRWKITGEKDFDELINFEEFDQYLPDNSKEDEIRGIYAYLPMGEGSLWPYLMLKSGIKKNLKCKIVVSQEANPTKKSELIIDLRPNVLRGDMWGGSFDTVEILEVF